MAHPCTFWQPKVAAAEPRCIAIVNRRIHLPVAIPRPSSLHAKACLLGNAFERREAFAKGCSIWFRRKFAHHAHHHSQAT